MSRSNVSHNNCNTKTYYYNYNDKIGVTSEQIAHGLGYQPEWLGVKISAIIKYLLVGGGNR